MFAVELEVPYEFRPVFDLTSLDPVAYGGNPALKVPSLAGPNGTFYGASNICRELARGAERPLRIVWSESFTTALLANAQELVLHVMNTEVALIMSSMRPSSDAAPSIPDLKLRATLASSLEWLETRWPEILSALPKERDLSFLEVTAFCVVRHLPFRKICEVDRFTALSRFASDFDERPSARATPFQFDVAP